MRGMRAYPCLLLFAAVSTVVLAQSSGDMEAVLSTDLGSFRIEFFPEKAPKHVAQFLSYSQKGFYDGTSFFRVLGETVDVCWKTVDCRAFPSVALRART
jgi:hypothetical protein